MAQVIRKNILIWFIIMKNLTKNQRQLLMKGCITTGGMIICMIFTYLMKPRQFIITMIWFVLVILSIVKTILSIKKGEDILL